MRSQDETGMNVQQFEDMAMSAVYNVCSIVTRPVELILRPFHGTRYFPLPVMFFSAILMILLPLLSAAATGVGQLIPFAGVRPPAGLFGIGALTKLYFLLSLVHSVRLYRRMIHMELEQNSEYEGPPLFFFKLLPGSNSFWVTRIVLEPAFVFVAASTLERIFILQSGLATYLQMAALMLAMQNFVAWYASWQYLRKLMDARFAGPIIAKLVENRATEDDLATVHLASFPKNLSPEIRQSAVAHIARVFSAKTDAPANASTPQSKPL